VPITEQVDFPQKFHKFLLENKADILRTLGINYNVQINVPKRGNEAADYLLIIGTKDNIEQCKPALAEHLAELELKNYAVEISEVRDELIPQLRGRNGAEVMRIEKKYEVRVEFSRRDEPNKIVIRGVRNKVEECEAFIRKKISDEASKTSQEIELDNRIHSRIIGQKGKTVAKIMEKFKVDIKFVGRNSDAVIVKGATAEAVDEACDHLKNLEEEYLQDVTEKDSYRHPSKSNEDDTVNTNGQSNGFVLRGAPWDMQSGGGSGNRGGNNSEASSQQRLNEPAPDTSNINDFPSISSAVAGADGAGSKSLWGPSRR